MTTVVAWRCLAASPGGFEGGRAVQAATTRHAQPAMKRAAALPHRASEGRVAESPALAARWWASRGAVEPESQLPLHPKLSAVGSRGAAAPDHRPWIFEGLQRFAASSRNWHGTCSRDRPWRRSGSAPVDGNGRARPSVPESRGLWVSTPNKALSPKNRHPAFPESPGHQIEEAPRTSAPGGFLLLGYATSRRLTAPRRRRRPAPRRSRGRTRARTSASAR